MDQFTQQAPPRQDIIRELRMNADRGASVLQLVHLVQASLGISEDKPLPVLWYFMEAFALPLPLVLPLREWMGEDRDKTIDERIIAAIANSRSQWSCLKAEKTTA